MTRRYEHEDELGFSATPQWKLLKELEFCASGASSQCGQIIETAPQTLSAEDETFLKECGIAP